jgi:hypothetical protein
MSNTTAKTDLAVAAAGAVTAAEAEIKAQLQVLEQLGRSAGPEAELNRHFVRFRQLLRAALRVLDDEATDA